MNLYSFCLKVTKQKIFFETNSQPIYKKDKTLYFKSGIFNFPLQKKLDTFIFKGMKLYYYTLNQITSKEAFETLSKEFERKLQKELNITNQMINKLKKFNFKK